MAKRFPATIGRNAAYAKADLLEASNTDISPTDGIMIDGTALSPSAITVFMGGKACTFNNLTPGVVYPFRITKFTVGSGSSLWGLYY